MIRCDCGSYAVNDDPEKIVCDVCFQKRKVRQLSEENAKLREARSCQWTYDESYDYYGTTCGNRWTFDEGNCEENKVVFCPFCGGTVSVKEKDSD